MDTSKKNAYLTYHLCVFLWGFTAILGKLITLTEVMLVWWRMGITCIVLLLIPQVWKALKKLLLKQVIQMACIGILVAIHWICFYGAIKYATVSVALVCLSTSSLFTSVLEPILLNKKFDIRELALGLAIIPGISLIFYFTGEYVTGIILGLCSALFATLFSILNKKLVRSSEPMAMTFVEIFFGFIFITMLLPVYKTFYPATTFTLSSHNLLLLVILSAFCTALPFSLSLKALKHLSVFTANLLLNLEPVYGILLATIIFKDYQTLTPGFYIGSVIILFVVFINYYLFQKNSI